jgi:hypothetical protein
MKLQGVDWDGRCWRVILRIDGKSKHRDRIVTGTRCHRAMPIARELKGGPGVAYGGQLTNIASADGITSILLKMIQDQT